MFRLATNEDVDELQKLLINAWRVTYDNLYTDEYIDSVISEFYNTDRLIKETSTVSRSWSGYYVLEDNNKIVGCIGGGIDDNTVGEIYVLYLDPMEKRKGYGTLLVELFTKIQKSQYNVVKQRVSVTEGNKMGIPFYKKIGFKVEKIKDTFFQVGKEEYKSISMIRNV